MRILLAPEGPPTASTTTYDTCEKANARHVKKYGTNRSIRAKKNERVRITDTPRLAHAATLSQFSRLKKSEIAEILALFSKTTRSAKFTRFGGPKRRHMIFAIARTARQCHLKATRPGACSRACRHHRTPPAPRSRSDRSQHTARSRLSGRRAGPDRRTSHHRSRAGH